MAAPAKYNCFSIGLGMHLWNLWAEGENGESFWQEGLRTVSPNRVCA